MLDVLILRLFTLDKNTDMLTMAKNLDGKRKILIAATNPRSQQLIAEAIQKQVANCQCYFSTDGLDVLSKLSNDIPHMLVVEDHLPKKNAIQLTESILANAQFNDMAVIIISRIPDTEHFVDEVVTGRVQFTEDFVVGIEKYLARALNFLAVGDKAEFHLAFLASDEVLMKEGDKPDFVYILKSGRLKAVSATSGKEIVLGTILPGEFVGEMAYINGEPRSASVIALTACELIRIPIAQLDHLLFQKPAWSKALIKTLSRRIRFSNEKASQQ